MISGIMEMHEVIAVTVKWAQAYKPSCGTPINAWNTDKSKEIFGSEDQFVLTLGK